MAFVSFVPFVTFWAFEAYRPFCPEWLPYFIAPKASAPTCRVTFSSPPCRSIM